MNTKISLELINTFILGFTAIFALILLLLTWITNRRNANASYGTFLLHQREKYSDPLMKESIEMLIDYYVKYPDDFNDRFLSERKMNIKLDNARRKFKFYFIEIFDLYKLNVIGTKQLNILTHYQSVAILLQIIKPIELSMNSNLPSYDLKFYKFYNKKFPIAANKEIKRI